MGISLGIDIGTTFTAAAVWRDERVEVVALEAHAVTVPTVIFASGDEMRFGAQAAARAATNPDAVAREFKRRLGDSVPIFLSGAPYSADRLVALFAGWVTDAVAAQFGERPERVVVTSPANWTDFQRHLLATALAQVGLTDVEMLSEPQAAAHDFGSVAHLEPGDLVMVYDLGGGTFDVALLQRDAVGFTHVGEAAGVERLGGIDFDEAVFQYVVGHVPEAVVAQARSDAAGRMALAQLRRACVEAKEMLSSEVAVDVPVMLPGLSSTVRLTRPEFEQMVRPMLGQTIDLSRQVLASAGLRPEELTAILLVGGSSRIPAVSEMVAAELSAPVRVDAHPKLVVARGAARWAGTRPQPGAARSGTGSRSTTTARKRRLLVPALVVAALVAAAAGWWLISGGGDDPARTGDTTSSSAGDTTRAAGPISTTTGSGTSTGSTAQPGTTAARTDLLPTPGAAMPLDTLVFSRINSSGTRQLWSLDLDRSPDDPLRVQRLASGGPAVFNHLPAISRDRRFIAYTTQVGGRNVLAVAAWDGGERQLVVDGQPVVVSEDARATWSPDGTRLAYVANRSGTDDLYVYDTRTGSEQQLTSDEFSETDPSWSPSSDEILYSVNVAGSGRDILRIAADGGTPEQVTAQDDDDSDPSWSPDGTMIAFARSGRAEGASTQLFVIDSDGTGERRIATTSVHAADPSWSPDGTRIVFESTDNQGLWIADASGADASQEAYVESGWILVHPAWT